MRTNASPGITPLGTVLGIFLCAMAPASAAPLVNETITYHQADGGTIEDIRDAMTANGSQSYWGYTQWYVAWSADCAVQKYTCRSPWIVDAE